MDETRPLRKRGIVSQNLGDESILYDPEANSIHFINAVAELVWSMCDGQHTVEEMKRRIDVAYEVPPGTNVTADVESIVASFAERGMLATTGV